MRLFRLGAPVAIVVLATAHASLQTPVEVPVRRVDYLAFAQGAMPVRVTGSSSVADAGEEQALRAVDGSSAPFPVATAAKDDTVVEFVYELPAMTTFDRFAVPNVIEAAGATTTFVRTVEVLGSPVGPDRGFSSLASAALVAHTRRGEFTELTLTEPQPVRWIRLRLGGALDTRADESTIEFTEIVGNGMQDPAPATYRFRGEWTGPGGSLSLRQQGPIVSGCFDTAGELSGTVSGNVLRAVGLNKTDKVRSAFVLGVAADGTVRGLRKTGTGAFRLYSASRSMPGLPARCTPAPVKLACGAVAHSIAFAPGTADLAPESEATLSALVGGLRTETTGLVTIEAHLAVNDGAAAANQALSLRRAQTVVDELARQGIPVERLRPAGAGSARPLVPGDDETASALNRRVEIRCQ